MARHDGFKSVYVMESKEALKVGVSRNPEERLKALSVGNPDIRVIYKSPPISNAYSAESAVHKALKSFQIKNEWFRGIGREEVIRTVKKCVSEFGCENERETMLTDKILKELQSYYDNILQELQEEIDVIGQENRSLRSKLISNGMTELEIQALVSNAENIVNEQYGLRIN